MNAALPKDFEVAPDVATETAFLVFKGMGEWALVKMLVSAGLVPHESRNGRVEQAMIVWFGGRIPVHNISLESVIAHVDSY